MAAGQPKPEVIYQMNLPNDAVGFDVERFDTAIRHHGVPFVHYRGMACPVGRIDPEDVRAPGHDDHEGCSHGFIYTKVGEVHCLFSGNSTQANFTDVGRGDGSTVTVTVPRFYDGREGEERVHIAKYDRLYLKDEAIGVTYWQLHQVSKSLLDKLDFPALKVHDVVDSAGRRYHEGVDFTLVDGKIKWGTNNPGVDPVSGKGRVYSVRYLYRPYYVVKNLIHEIRVVQASDPLTGERTTQRMPHQLSLQREYMEHDSNTGPAEPSPSEPGTPSNPAAVIQPTRLKRNPFGDR